jgi:tetratricopeptide (TPR) repeat protein
MKKALAGVMLLCFCVFSLGAAERMTVALLDPRNASGDTNTAHWQYAITLLMNAQLREVKSIRLLPESSIYYAFRQLKLKGGRPISADQARKLGEIIEARRVVWSEYSLKGKKHTLSMWVVNVASGKVSKKLTASGPDWFQVASNSVNSVLHELSVTPTPDEEARMNLPPTRSAGALELFALGAAKNEANSPLTGTESLLRKSASIDPAFPAPLEALAKLILFMGQDRADEAEQTAEQAVNIRPDYAAPHNVLGMVYEFKGMNYIARDELVQAVRLDPDDPDNYDRLGEIYGRMSRTANAVTNFNEAARLAPYDAKPHAYLGEVYAIQGNRDEALQELKIAEHFNPGDVRELMRDSPMPI